MAKNNEKFVSRENAKTLWGYMVDLLTGKYTKPSGGIPKSDLESSVQTSLGKADTALQSFEETDPTVPSWAKATNKPSYTQDEVGDGTTYKRVSSTEKDIWNAKGTYSKPSGGIPKSDLASAVQTSLEKADSALQSYTETDPTVPSWAKQTSKPSYNSDEISDTNRTHKFATQSQLNQISTNQTNILYTLNRTGKNLAKELPTQTVNGVTLTNNGDGTYTVTRTASDYNAAQFVFGDNSNGKLTGCILTGGAVGYGLKGRIGDTSSSAVSSTDWTTPKTITSEVTGVISVGVDSNENPQNVQLRPFICEADVYAIDPSFVKPALPNYDLTQLEAEDRNALVEVIDEGAKNILKINQASNSSAPCFTSDLLNTVTVNGTTASGGDAFDLNRINGSLVLPAGTYVISTPDDMSNLGFRYYERVGGTLQNQSSERGEKYLIFTVSGSATENWCRLESNVGTTFSNRKVRLMICTKAAFGVSNKFVAYNTMAQWTKVETEYTSTAADTMEYCGVSFRVPANEIYEFIVMDRYNAGKPNGIGVADNSTNYSSNSTVIAENMADFSVSNVYPWARQLTGMTIPRNQDTRYYVWVKRGSASKNSVYLMYRRIL